MTAHAESSGAAASAVLYDGVQAGVTEALALLGVHEMNAMGRSFFPPRIASFPAIGMQVKHDLHSDSDS